MTASSSTPAVWITPSTGWRASRSASAARSATSQAAIVTDAPSAVSSTVEVGGVAGPGDEHEVPYTMVADQVAGQGRAERARAAGDEDAAGDLPGSGDGAGEPGHERGPVAEDHLRLPGRDRPVAVRQHEPSGCSDSAARTSPPDGGGLQVPGERAFGGDHERALGLGERPPPHLGQRLVRIRRANRSRPSAWTRLRPGPSRPGTGRRGRRSGAAPARRWRRRAVRRRRPDRWRRCRRRSAPAGPGPPSRPGCAGRRRSTRTAAGPGRR